VGIVTLWTPVEKILKDIPDESYVVAGQLFTKRGVNFIFRNILANPQIRYLVVCGQDRTGSGEALLNFETSDPESEKVLGLVRENVEVIDLRGEIRGTEVAKVIKTLEVRPPFGEPQILAEPKIQTAIFPTDLSLIKIRRPTVGEAWVEVLKNLLKFGVKSEAVHHYFDRKVNEYRELLNLAVVIENEDPAEPKICDYFPFGRRDLDNYFQEFLRPERGEQPYTYGERLLNYEGLNQVEKMVEKLRRFSYDKGALAVLWQPKVDNFPVRQPWRTPCLTLIQGQCLGEKLYLTVYFRSNDMFGAWPLDALALRLLQKKIADEVGVGLGSLITISNMAHLYGHDFAAAAKIVEENDKLWCEWDPRGNFAIRVEDDLIKVEHLSPDGAFLQKFEGRTAREIYQKLDQALAVSLLSHAFDLGCELQKAEIALKSDLAYHQDQPLKFNPSS
jgi:thymidylate synthase